MKYTTLYLIIGMFTFGYMYASDKPYRDGVKEDFSGALYGVALWPAFVGVMVGSK